MSLIVSGQGCGPTRSADRSPDRNADRNLLGPVFMASHESHCEGCDEWIVPGEDIRADGYGNYIHADDMCEAVVTR